MSDATLYKWKAKYGGMTVSELRRLKDLEAENAELKRLLGDAMLDNAGLKGLLAKKLLTVRHEAAVAIVARTDGATMATPRPMPDHATVPQ